MLSTIVLFLLGLVFVWKGADFLIDGSGGLARRFGVRAFIVGLTVVSFGTSAPELIVNLFAATRGASGLAIGNVLGSNVANLLLILGAAALMGTVHAQRSTLRWELPATIAATLLVATMIYLPLRPGTALTRLDAAILLILFAAFLVYVYRLAKAGVRPPPILSAMHPGRSIVLILLGAIGLGVGAHWLVENGLQIAAQFGLTEGFVGFFLIALGTSMPELAATIAAVRKDHGDIALGNIIGSNLFNLLFVLGVTGLVIPLPAASDTPLQLASATAAPLLVLLLFLPKKQLGRAAGITLVLGYVAWIIWLGMHIRV